MGIKWHYMALYGIKCYQSGLLIRRDPKGIMEQSELLPLKAQVLRLLQLLSQAGWACLTSRTGERKRKGTWEDSVNTLEDKRQWNFMWSDCAVKRFCEHLQKPFTSALGSVIVFTTLTTSQNQPPPYFGLVSLHLNGSNIPSRSGDCSFYTWSFH